MEATKWKKKLSFKKIQTHIPLYPFDYLTVTNPHHRHKPLSFTGYLNDRHYYHEPPTETIHDDHSDLNVHDFNLATNSFVAAFNPSNHLDKLLKPSYSGLPMAKGVYICKLEHFRSQISKHSSLFRKTTQVMISVDHFKTNLV